MQTTNAQEDKPLKRHTHREIYRSSSKMFWLRLLAMMFYAPGRALETVRERGEIIPAFGLAWAAQIAFLVYTEWAFVRADLAHGGIFAPVSLALQAARPLVYLAFVFAPLFIVAATLIDRRDALWLAVQREFAPMAATLFYGWAAATLIAFPLALLANYTGTAALQAAETLRVMENYARGMSPEETARVAPLITPRLVIHSIFLGYQIFPCFVIYALLALRRVFSLTWFRTLTAFLVACLIAPILILLFAPILEIGFGSPLLVLLLIVMLRGKIDDWAQRGRARAAFQQNLETATLNPADAGAHYQLGLLYQQRHDLTEARARFERAIKIDSNETDAHYQLGRIAREQNRLAEAVAHFEEVVQRDQAHVQYEIWREIGATYLAAEQFSEAREMLERFCEHRAADPEGLYLLGRAYAALGNRRLARESMENCIAAVKAAPVYKYRIDKRWLNEAQQYLRSQS